MSIKTKIAGFREILTFDNWPLLLLERLVDRQAGLIIYRKNGLDILIDHRGDDPAGTRQCICSDMYTRYLPFLSLIGPVRVLDLGSNGGGFPLMLKLAGVDLARIVCVEMNPATYSRLLVNLRTNIGFSAVAINAAVCATPNSEVLLKPTWGGTSESIDTNRSDSSQPHVSVRTTTLKDLCEQYFNDGPLDLCKIDIEGAEYDVLASTPLEVLGNIRHIVIEFHDPSRSPAAIERIVDNGFTELAIGAQHKTDDTTEVRVFRRRSDLSTQAKSLEQSAP